MRDHLHSELVALTFGVLAGFLIRSPAATAHLRYLLDLLDGDLSLAFAAYNAGENAVLRSDGIPPFAKTRGHVRKVTALYGGAVGEPGVRRKAAGGKPTLNRPRPIYSYVDSAGMVHFTNE